MLERQYFQVDVFSKSGTADILLGNLDGCRVDIRSVAFESELAFITFIVIDTVEQLLVEVDPFLASERFAVDTLRDDQR